MAHFMHHSTCLSQSWRIHYFRQWMSLIEVFHDRIFPSNGTSRGMAHSCRWMTRFPWSILPKARAPPLERVRGCKWMMLRGFRCSIVPWARAPPFERAPGCQWMRFDKLQWSILPMAEAPPEERALGCQWMMFSSFPWSILPWQGRLPWRGPNR